MMSGITKSFDILVTGTFYMDYFDNFDKQN